MPSNETCRGCGNCVIACPVNSEKDWSAAGGKGPASPRICLKVDGGEVTLVDPSLCDACDECVDACPIPEVAIKPLINGVERFRASRRRTRRRMYLEELWS